MVASIVVVLVDVATFQWVTSSLRGSSGSFEWRTPPGQDYGFFAVTIIVIDASIINATFEELLGRIGFQGLFTGRGRAMPQWLVLSLIFGLFHINGTPGGVLRMAFAGLFGFAMCFIREMSKGSVSWLIVAHFVADVILIGGVYGINV